MKYSLVLVQLAFGFGLLPCAVTAAYPHGGGLDAYGCHHNRKAGGYRCLTGESFNSTDEMLRKLGADKRDLETKAKK